MRILSIITLVLICCCCQRAHDVSSPQDGSGILQSLKPVQLPLLTENLPGEHEPLPNDADALMPQDVKRMELRAHDSIDFATREIVVDLAGYKYWLLGKISSGKNYETVLVETVTPSIQYAAITFTPQGKLIDKLVISEETGEEGQVYTTESILDSKQNIIVKERNTFSEPYDVLSPITETSYTIDDAGKFIRGSSREYFEDTEVSWYSISDAGLLMIEKERGNSIHFSLQVFQGESCVGETDGIAIRQPDQSYTFKEDINKSACVLNFTINPEKVVLKETTETESSTCEHGATCSFEGTYKKLVTEKISAVRSDIIQWPRKTIDEITCMLEKDYDYKSTKYKCNVKAAEISNPNDSSWYSGPVFADDKVKMIHPLIKDIEFGWEHNNLRTITINFEKEVMLQSVQRIFNLPRTKEDQSNYYPNLYQVDYGSLSEDDVRLAWGKPLLIKSLTLTAFEHMGSGD